MNYEEPSNQVKEQKNQEPSHQLWPVAFTGSALLARKVPGWFVATMGMSKQKLKKTPNGAWEAILDKA